MTVLCVDAKEFEIGILEYSICMEWSSGVFVGDRT
jgi:hypothetical protein